MKQATQQVLAPLVFFSALVIAGLVPAYAQTPITINFEQYKGPSTAPITAQSVTIGIATFTGGGFCTACTNSPNDQTTIYITTSTDPNLGLACNGCVSTITISFSEPVSNFSLLLINGEPYDVIYQVQDNQGHTVQAYLGSNTASSGATTVSLPYLNIQQVVVSKVTGGLVNGWDFSIDNVSFIQPCTVSSVTVQTNENCSTAIGQNCSANIVLANGIQSTQITTTVQPAQTASVHLTADYGTVSDVMTDTNGKATSSYGAGAMPADPASTPIGHISATACGTNFGVVARVYNFGGFDFHQSQVPVYRFTLSDEWSVSDIQAFFSNKGSFLANFILVGDSAGFLDLNGNGKLDPGEPVYLAYQGAKLAGATRSAAKVFADAATKYGVNPKLVLDLVQREQSLISFKLSSQVLPSTIVLNDALGCGGGSTFVGQANCAASALINNFNAAPSMPYFSKASAGIQHYVYNSLDGDLGKQPVGFQQESSATYSLYKYDPFIEEVKGGGGVYLFEILWKQYAF